MKRDMELIIKLALIIESRTSEESGLEVHLDEYEDDLVQYNLGLMANGGMIEAIDASSMDGELFLPLKLTWAGHDFLDATRNEAVINKTKDYAKSKGLQLFDLPFEIIKEMATQTIKGMIFG